MDSTLATAAIASGGAVTAAYALKFLGGVYRSKVLIPKLTILNDLPNIGKVGDEGRMSARVIIAGGSVAGLYAAAVCSYHFEEVIVVDPDHIDDLQTFLPPRETFVTTEGYVALAKKRPRVMQYDALHAFQPISPMAMEGLFSHYKSELDQLGIIPGPADFCAALDGKPFPFPFEAREDAPSTLFLSREGYETLLRRLVVQDCPNVRFVTGLVTGLKVSEEDPKTVTAVSIRTSDQREDTVEEGALFIDATGPTQAGFHKWLPTIGASLPAKLRETYHPHWQGMTIWIRIPQKLQSKLPIPGGYQGQKWLYTGFPQTDTPERRHFAIGIVEGDTLVLGPGGWGVDEKFTSLEPIRDFCAEMHGNTCPSWVLEILDVLIEHQDELEPRFTPVKMGPLSLINYQDAPKGLIPHNFIAIGDSVMQVNPVYGQGCSKAIIGAVTLDRLLRELQGIPLSFSKKFFALQFSRIKGTWTGTKPNDYGFETTTPAEGEKPGDFAFKRAFVRKAVSLVLADMNVTRVSFMSRMFLAPPTDLMAPSILSKMFWRWLTGADLS